MCRIRFGEYYSFSDTTNSNVLAIRVFVNIQCSTVPGMKNG